MIDLRLGISKIVGNRMTSEPDSEKTHEGATSGSVKTAQNGRLAEALRENLRRRKAQERGRRAATAERPENLPD
jgi:hypothetical protein